MKRICALLLVTALCNLWAGSASAQAKKAPRYEGKPLAYWVQQLQSQKADQRDAAWQAVLAFGREGTTAALPVLTEMLDDLAPGFRVFGARHLGQLGPEAESAVPALAARTRSEHRELAWHAVGALKEIGPAAKAALPDLHRAFKEAARLDAADARFFRDRITAALEAIGPAAVPLLTDLLGSGDELRPNIASALGRLGPEARAAIPALLRTLKDTRQDLRAEAAWALWRIAKHRDAVLALVSCLASKDGAPGALLGPFVMRPLEEYRARDLPDGWPYDISKREIHIHADVISKLAEIGPGAKAAVPFLEPLLAAKKSPLREEAAWALWKIAKHKGAAPALVDYLWVTDHELPVRLYSQTCARLEEIGPEAKAALPALLKALPQAGRSREELLGLIRKIDPQAAKDVQK